jgi:hypothetical protein
MLYPHPLEAETVLRFSPLPLKSSNNNKKDIAFLLVEIKTAIQRD